MDADPAVEPILDGFSRILPLPYRVSIILVCGVWAWGLNLHYLHAIKIDVPALIRYGPPSNPHLLPRPALLHHTTTASQRSQTHHTSTYRLATILTIPLIASLLLFWLITHGQPARVAAWQILPQAYLAFFFVVLAIPIKRLSHNGRSRFVQTLKRVSLGGLTQPSEGKFGDILLADVLTSYAKVLGDLFVSTCMLFDRSTTSTSTPNRNCGGAYLVPLVIAVPYLIRLRQCLIEYIRVRRDRANHPGWGGQHLANALKYSSAFPVIILSAIQRGYDPAKIHMSPTTLFRLWLFFVFLNSMFSFYWDVAKDWDLTLFSFVLSRSKRHVSEQHQHPTQHQTARPFPPGLRKNRHFHHPQIYYTAIILDLFLRGTWSIKLSPHLDHFNDLEGGIFLMEFLELVRRWMWVFLRVETEWVRNLTGSGSGSTGGNGEGDDDVEDILLGDFGKIDED